MKNICLILISFLLAFGCEESQKVRENQAAVATITLGKYCSQNGTLIQPVWDASQGAKLLVGAQAYTGKPVRVEPEEGVFLFTLNGVYDRQEVVGIYPAEASVQASQGELTLNLPTTQDGTLVPCMAGKGLYYSGVIEKFRLTPLYATLYIQIARGNYRISKIQVQTNAGEGIVGDLRVDIPTWTSTATEAELTLVPPQAIDCSTKAQMMAAMVAATSLSQGYTVTLTTTENEAFSITVDEPLVFDANAMNRTPAVDTHRGTELLFCGDSRVMLINADLADATGYSEAILWEWDAATIAQHIPGAKKTALNHLDECKPVNLGKDVLVTSSYGMCALVNRESGKPLFFVSDVPNAHSAELLPGNRVAVATSDGNTANHHSLRIYDLSSAACLLSVPLNYGHAVVWNEHNQRLYAAGSNIITVYKLQDWEGTAPGLVVENTVSAPGDIHDMMLVDGNTLSVAGTKAFFYDITSKTFTPIAHLQNSTALKSLNCNKSTGDFWYTDATQPEGTQTWSTQTIRYWRDVNGSVSSRTIKVPDMDMYKVRVLNW